MYMWVEPNYAGEERTVQKVPSQPLSLHRLYQHFANRILGDKRHEYHIGARSRAEYR